MPTFHLLFIGEYVHVVVHHLVHPGIAYFILGEGEVWWKKLATLVKTKNQTNPHLF